MRFGAELLAFTDGDVWRPGIGDPTVMGWVTVAAYFTVAVMCLRQASAFRFRRGDRGRLIFWTALAGLLVLLGVNKQLDLQTALTLTGRRIAIAQGWYEHRRAVQLVFVGIVAISGAVGFTLMWKLVRAHGREVRVALAGFLLLLCFVVVRAASFHHFDNVINFRMGGVRMNWVLELGSIAVIAAGASKARQGAPSEHARRRAVAA
jgi:hypothetical protein